MFLIIGLGNPGEKYEKTRHNLGFLALDNIQKEFELSDWKQNNIFLSHESKGEFLKNEITLLKPQTFMNNSGKAIKKLVTSHKLSDPKLVVIHDDIDLEIGNIKIVQNRGAGGHKGIESIINHIGNKNFIRVRLGIKPKTGKPQNTEKFVIQKFNKAEEEILPEIIKTSTEIIKSLLKEGLQKTMNKFH